MAKKIATRSVVTAATLNAVSMIDPKLLRIVPGYNVRDAFDSKRDEADKELKASILAQGVTTPIVVYTGDDGKFYITAGHRRFAAVSEINREGGKIARVPVIAEKAGATEADRILDLYTSNSGKPLNPLQRGTIFLRLRAVGWKDAQIAKQAGVSTRYVLDLCNLANAPDDVKALVRDGKISSTLATETLQSQGKDTGKVLKAALAKAPVSGKKAGKIAAPAVKAAIAETGKVPAKGKLASKPVQPVAPVPTPAAKPVKQPVDDGKTPALRGPFAVDAKTNGGCGLLDGNREGIGAACDPGHARAMVSMLNLAWAAMNKGGKKAA